MASTTGATTGSSLSGEDGTLLGSESTVDMLAVNNECKRLVEEMGRGHNRLEDKRTQARLGCKDGDIVKVDAGTLDIKKKSDKQWKG